MNVWKSPGNYNKSNGFNHTHLKQFTADLESQRTAHRMAWERPRLEVRMGGNFVQAASLGRLLVGILCSELQADEHEASLFLPSGPGTSDISQRHVWPLHMTVNHSSLTDASLLLWYLPVFPLCVQTMQWQLNQQIQVIDSNDRWLE